MADWKILTTNCTRRNPPQKPGSTAFLMALEGGDGRHQNSKRTNFIQEIKHTHYNASSPQSFPTTVQYKKQQIKNRHKKHSLSGQWHLLIYKITFKLHKHNGHFWIYKRLFTMKDNTRTWAAYVQSTTYPKIKKKENKFVWSEFCWWQPQSTHK